MKIPASPEFLTSIARTDFIERSMTATHLGSPRDWGVMASGAPFGHFEYMLGVYAGDGRTQPPSRAQRTIGGRLAYVVRPNLDG